MIDLNKIVKKLGKYNGAVVTIDELSDIVDPDFKKRPTDRRFPVYKALYQLKALDRIATIRKGLYLVGEHASESIGNVVEDRYWMIVWKLLVRETSGEYLLSGNKALEIYLRDYSLPEKLVVYTRECTTKSLRISPDHTISLRSISSGKKTGNRDLYTLLKRFVRTLEIEGAKIRVACPELALLDALLVRDTVERVDVYLIEKFLKRSSKTLKRDILGQLVTHKYITAINRLREIAKNMGDSALYETCLSIIKREGGGCFITPRS